ncbi:MAG TPA: hypothetical protein VMF08_15050 [Candidatus Sulfotelmatobacter sp.]|nr:hypothetical protein [Candidatus Sulfotelmatobacter sp.]
MRRRSPINTTARDIPVRFGRGAAGFDIKIKKSARDRILGLEMSLVQGPFDLYTRARGIAGMLPMPLLRRRSEMALVTLLDARRLETVLKTTRKKRC